MVVRHILNSLLTNCGKQRNFTLCALASDYLGTLKNKPYNTKDITFASLGGKESTSGDGNDSPLGSIFLFFKADEKSIDVLSLLIGCNSSTSVR